MVEGISCIKRPLFGRALEILPKNGFERQIGVMTFFICLESAFTKGRATHIDFGDPKKLGSGFAHSD